MKMNGQEAAWWLSCVPGLGAVRLRQLSELLGRPERIWDLVESEGNKNGWEEESVKQTALYELLQEKTRAWQEHSGERCVLSGQNLRQLLLHRKEAEKSVREYHRWTEQGIKFITVWDNEYPGRLSALYDRPYALYLRGVLPEAKRPAAAIIGARACSLYGSSQARRMGRELAKAGVQIISGLAYGIDSAGHKGALESGMNAATFAVLGCGPDQCYPREHTWLAERILENGGGILSEFAPGAKALAGHFPMRNRIISGLSDCILVMEARERSGSLITVDQALEQGKEVFALPGRVDDPLSAGCHRLLQNGAALLSGSTPVLDFLLPNRKIEGHGNINSEDFGKNALAPEKNMVYSCLDYQGKTIEEIIALTGLPLAVVRTRLLELLMAGRITETAKGCYARLSRSKE
ncbi:MAG: DNA-protecting protein DprA [Lachnospiraceae bacterium]|nr:DNA-protecting protein DprA [Lachnospiraceae bacterium]